MKIEFDFSELIEFAERLPSMYEFDNAIMTATQQVARVLHNHLLNLTPVDTGNLRKMWSAGNNLRFTVEDLGNKYQVTFVNEASANSKDGVKYGVLVNDGHKSRSGGWVMGRFFVEKSIDLTLVQLENIVMKELQKWWDSV